MGMLTGNSEEEDIDDVRRRPGGNKTIQGFGKLLVQVAVGHHDDPQTVNRAVATKYSSPNLYFPTHTNIYKRAQL
jgi:hypothetical protein